MTALDPQAELERSIFTYSENQTRVDVNGDGQLHNLEFEHDRLVKYVLHKETSLSGTFDRDTITFEYESGDLKAIKLNKINYPVEVDGRGNISRITGWDIAFQFDDKPNPFRGIPSELILFEGADSELLYINILLYFNKNNITNTLYNYSYSKGQVKKIRYTGASGYEFVQEIKYKFF